MDMTVKTGSHTARILSHLAAGQDITRLEAMTVFHIQNLTARISEIKAAGFYIDTTIKTDPNGAEYAVYSMPFAHHQDAARAIVNAAKSHRVAAA